MTKSFSDMATRTANGINSFVEFVINATGMTHDEALKVYHVYLDLKVLKIDVTMGSYKIKHGALMDAECFNNALAMAGK